MDLAFQLIFTVIGAFLSVMLTLIFVQNGRQIRMLGEKMDEGFRKMDEGFRKMDEGFRKMDEGLRKIGELIVVEERSTRELIKEIKG
jgi:low affinity Fe/Cu permease